MASPVWPFNRLKCVSTSPRQFRRVSGFHDMHKHLETQFSNAQDHGMPPLAPPAITPTPHAKPTALPPEITVLTCKTVSIGNVAESPDRRLELTRRSAGVDETDGNQEQGQADYVSRTYANEAKLNWVDGVERRIKLNMLSKVDGMSATQRKAIIETIAHNAEVRHRHKSIAAALKAESLALHAALHKPGTLGHHRHDGGSSDSSSSTSSSNLSKFESAGFATGHGALGRLALANGRKQDSKENEELYQSLLQTTTATAAAAAAARHSRGSHGHRESSTAAPEGLRVAGPPATKLGSLAAKLLGISGPESSTGGSTIFDAEFPVEAYERPRALVELLHARDEPPRKRTVGSVHGSHASVGSRTSYSENESRSDIDTPNPKNVKQMYLQMVDDLDSRPRRRTVTARERDAAMREEAASMNVMRAVAQNLQDWVRDVLDVPTHLTPHEPNPNTPTDYLDALPALDRPSVHLKPPSPQQGQPSTSATDLSTPPAAAGTNSKPATPATTTVTFDILLNACKPTVLETKPPLRVAVDTEANPPENLLQSLELTLGVPIARTAGGREGTRVRGRARDLKTHSRVRKHFGSWYVPAGQWGKLMSTGSEFAPPQAKFLKASSGIVQRKLDEIMVRRAKEDQRLALFLQKQNLASQEGAS